MKRFILSATASSLLFASLAGATTLVDTYGDKDGFGIGITENSFFLPDNVVASGDEGFTDQWTFGTKSYEHTFDFSLLAGPITSAYLEIFSGGQGWYDQIYGYTKVAVNGQNFGSLSDGDFTEHYVGLDEQGNYARRDVINLLSLGDFSVGFLTVSIETMLPADGWVLDYSTLTISDDPAPVPEPATLMLFGTGIAGLASMRRLKKNRKPESGL